MYVNRLLVSIRAVGVTKADTYVRVPAVGCAYVGMYVLHMLPFVLRLMVQTARGNLRFAA